MLLSGLILVLGTQLAAQPSPPKADTIAVARKARAAARDLMRTWRREWLRGYRDTANNKLRDAAGHCHFDGVGPNHPPNLILSGTRRSMCPTWYPLAEVGNDERRGIDAPLPEVARNRIRVRRAAVLALLDTAVAGSPDNAALHGQRVRFAVDQRDSAQTRRAVEQCGALDGWCALLGVYAAAQFGDLMTADSLVDVALNRMAIEQRCSWNDVAWLLDPSDKKAYDRRDCADRIRLERVFWWLADPLWTQPRNERRAEHYSRQVAVVLRAELEADERFDWRRDKGGLALAQLVVRYGWPSFVGWLGRLADDGHRSWLGFDDNAVTTPTAEYTTPRTHTVPLWRTVANPSTLDRDDWRDMSPRRSRNRWDFDWWAQEHMMLSSGPIVAIPDQTAFFRRAHNALIAVATQMPGEVFRGSDRHTASLVLSAAPDSALVVQRLVSTTGRVALTAPVLEPCLVSMEILAESRTVAGRSRYAVVPLSGLDELPKGEIALSDLALFEVDPEAMPPASVDELLPRMLPSPSVPRGARLGVFWETYGLDTGDVVDVRLRVERDEEGFLRRLAAMTGFASDEKAAVEISWREPQGGFSGRAFADGGVRVQPRAITLGLAALEAGRYTVMLKLTPAGGPAAVSVRPLVIR